MLSVLWPIVPVALAASQLGTPGKIVEKVPCPSDPTQTYSLYLPSAYATTRSWPLLIVFDPGGHGARAAEVFREAAERFGWIVAASETSRNGPWDLTVKAINAMWPALLGGYAIDERRVYTAGHSGGATAAWMIARETGRIAGVIASGQPGPGQDAFKNAAFAWFGAAGRADFNYMEVKGIDERLGRSRVPHRMEFFDGGHQWPPADVAVAAIGWMELLAMKDGRRARDPVLAAQILAADMARARSAEQRGRLTDAWRAYRSIESYGGMIDVSAAEARRKLIESDQRYKTLRKDEARADNRERRETDNVQRMIAALPEVGAPPVQRLRSDLRLDALIKSSRGDSSEAEAARRSLALIRVQLATLIRELQERGDGRTRVLQNLLDSMPR